MIHTIDTRSFILLKVLSQDETPFLYSVVFGEGVVNDATSIVIFNAVQSLDFSNVDGTIALKLLGTFLYLFFTSTALGIAVSHFLIFPIKFSKSMVYRLARHAIIILCLLWCWPDGFEFC